MIANAVSHQLATDRYGQVAVVVPHGWDDYGFVIQVAPIVDKPLVRLHSRCAYGEVFGSMHCDCKPQLDAAMELIAAEGGLMIYLEQEGRGAGILAKAQAYEAHAVSGVDTFTHYSDRGLNPDGRDYAIAAQHLVHLGLRSVRLLTNNPAKVEAIEAVGIYVDRVPCVVDAPRLAESYLEAKRQRGHLL